MWLLLLHSDRRFFYHLSCCLIPVKKKTDGKGGTYEKIFVFSPKIFPFVLNYFIQMLRYFFFIFYIAWGLLSIFTIVSLNKEKIFTKFLGMVCCTIALVAILLSRPIRYEIFYFLIIIFFIQTSILIFSWNKQIFYHKKNNKIKKNKIITFIKKSKKFIYFFTNILLMIIFLIIVPTCPSRLSPARCPLVSLKDLNLSRSRMAKANEPP